MSERNKHSVAVVIFFAWLGSAIIGFWWIEFKDLRPFNPDASNNSFVLFEGMTAHTTFDVSAMTGAVPDKAFTVVHFWNPECACNRFNESHVREIIQLYGKSGVRFIVAVKPSAQYTTQQLTQLAQKRLGIRHLVYTDDQQLRQLNIPATPAALVLNQAGGIAYFGPYSDGANCSRNDSRFIEKTLSALLGGGQPAQINMAGYGCYCDLQTLNTREA